MLEGLNWIQLYLSLTHALVLMASSRDTVMLANGGLRGRRTHNTDTGWWLLKGVCVCKDQNEQH